MSDPIKINVNNSVQVKLLPSGREALRLHYKDLVTCGLPQTTADHFLVKLQGDAEGYYKMQLWELMNLLGPLMQRHLPSPIETTILVSNES